MSYEQYEHHGRKVWVRSDLKGTHRDICLCFSCKTFYSGCPIAKDTFDNCKKHGLVTPVLECPEFEEKK